MLEHACYCGNYYGTPRKAVFDKLEEGKDVILEIEVQGAMKIKENAPMLCSCSFSLHRWEPSATALKSVAPKLPRS